MDKDNAIQKLPHRQEGWKGYTLEDIRYRRAYMAARRELEKERVKYNLSSLRTNVGSGAVSAMQRVASGIPMISYGLLAFNVVSKGFRIIRPLLPKRKKKALKA